MIVPRKVLYIAFEDHYSDSFEWLSVEELTPPEVAVVYAVGFLLQETDEIIQLCLLSDNEDSQVSGCMNILKSAITEMYELIL